MTSPFPCVYLRGLRAVQHSVFNVQDGQKAYRDPHFGTLQAYASGQQVKRSLLESVLTHLGQAAAPLTFNWLAKTSKSAGLKLKQKEVFAPCDPRHIDQLLGGYMRVDRNPGIKRRSPLSVSALRPLHPLLGGLERALENLTVDRRGQPQHHVVVRDETGEQLTSAQVAELLETTERELPKSAWFPDHKRVTGLFVYDIAVDLGTLLCVSLDAADPQLPAELAPQLLEQGWTRVTNRYGPALLLPAADREPVLAALAEALLGWRITTNQSRTFSLQETLAVALSPRADELAGAIRGQLVEGDGGQSRARPVLDAAAGADLYVTLAADGHVPGIVGRADALTRARQALLSQLRGYEQHLRA